MKAYKAPYYTYEQLELLDESEIKYPYSDDYATYIGSAHQYELTARYFEDRGRNLVLELDGNNPHKVENFLKYLRMKVYTHIYMHSKSSRSQLNYLIAKRGLHGFSMAEYRETFLEAMYIEGCYLLDNGDISNIAGVDLDIMQNISVDVMRNQDRDFHKDAIGLLTTLGLNYFGRYKFMPQGGEW